MTASHTSTHTKAHTKAHTSTHTKAHTSTHTKAHTKAHTCTHMHTHARAHTHTQGGGGGTPLAGLEGRRERGKEGERERGMRARTRRRLVERPFSFVRRYLPATHNPSPPQKKQNIHTPSMLLSLVCRRCPSASSVARELGCAYACACSPRQGPTRAGAWA